MLLSDINKDGDKILGSQWSVQNWLRAQLYVYIITILLTDLFFIKLQNYPRWNDHTIDFR